MTSHFPPAPRNAQEIFDRAALHLLTTRQPSGRAANGTFACFYGGSGCALRPFAPLDPQELAKWDEQGAIGDLPHDWLPEWMQDELELLSALQDAHDSAALQTLGEPKEWFALWAEKMQLIAASARLDATLITDALALEAPQ